jgi:hypothetical protein
MSGYRKKDAVRLAYDANKKRLRCEGQVILDAVLNEALDEMDRAFQDALSRGEILHIGGSAEEMRAFLRLAAEKQLAISSK